MPATSILQKKTNDPSKEGKSFPGCFQSNISDLQCYRRNFSPRGFFKLLVYNKLPELFFFFSSKSLFLLQNQANKILNLLPHPNHTHQPCLSPSSSLLFVWFGLFFLMSILTQGLIKRVSVCCENAHRNFRSKKHWAETL